MCLERCTALLVQNSFHIYDIYVLLQVLRGIRKMGGVGVQARGGGDKEEEKKKVEEVKEEEEEGSESGVSEASTDIAEAFEGIGDESEEEEEEEEEEEMRSRVEEEEEDGSSDSEVESSAL